VHPQHNTQADWGWIKKGETFPIPSNTGRERINLKGVIERAFAERLNKYAHDVTDVVM
jgi:hypothetical protein